MGIIQIIPIFISETMLKYNVLIPAYNAASTLPRLLQNLRQLDIQPQNVLVVDDGSSDETADISLNMNANLLRLKENTGKGYALRQGWNYLLQNYKIEYLLIMDADLQHPVSSIPDFLEFAEQKRSKFIIGMRELSLKKMPIHRILSNRMTSLIISLLCGQKIIDSQCGFRMIHRDVLTALQVYEDGFQLESEMILRASDLGVTIDFIAIPTLYDSERSHIENIHDTFKFITLILKEILTRIRCVFKNKAKH